MKLSKLALAGAIAGLLSAGTAYAQNGLQQPQSVRQTAFEYSSYYSQDYDQQAGAKERGVEGEPDPQAPASAETPAEDEPSFGNGAGTILNPCCCLGEQWKLIDNECLTCRNINIAGWLAQSYTWNTASPNDRWNGPVTWTDRSNEYQLNQLYMFAEKTTDTEGCGWDIGGRIDALWGTDNRFTTTAGLETRAQFQQPKWSTYRFYGLALPQTFAELAYNDWKAKIGHFYAPVGYEVVPTTGNFFPSLPYTFQYGEPFTFTGVHVTYAITDKSTIGGGITQGWDNLDARNPNTGFFATYAETFEDGGAFAYSAVATNEQTFAAGNPFRQRYLQTAVYSRPLNRISERLTYVIQSDFGFQNDALADGSDAKWYGLNQYLFYKVSDCMTYGIRAEWFRDQDGYRVGGFLGGTNPTPGNPEGGSLRGLPLARSGYTGSFYEVTMGANWKYSANTTVRPYARFDWFSGDSAGGPGFLPFADGNGNSQTLLGFDVVTLF